MTDFKYHSDPIFDEFQRKKITENSIISVTVSKTFKEVTSVITVSIVLFPVNLDFVYIALGLLPPLPMQGSGFARAMTAEEAEAFLGDAECVVNTLQDDKLFLDPPTSPPRLRSKRPKRDTSSDQLDLVVSN